MALFNISTIVKDLRTAQGLSQYKLAEGICSRQTIGTYGTMVEK